jgi:protein O-mannosyl-transferase
MITAQIFRIRAKREVVAENQSVIMHRATAEDRLSRRDWLVAVLLAGTVFAAFAPALDCKFIGFDDPIYVSENPLVLQGLSREGVIWAFTTFRLANWHPLTWLSFELDATLMGPGPRGFHLTNVLLHAANAALLFLALRTLTREFWPSVAVALLFAVHPLRVESVAWVSERKDVLSAFFGLLALWAYAWYARNPSVVRYSAIFIALLCSLLSKSMFVTLPCLFLVLDWWPLRRTESWRRLVGEKLPLAAIVLAISVVTFQAQESRGASKGLEQYPVLARMENAAIAYAAYLAKTAWPSGLAIFYPHPLYPGAGGLSHEQAMGSALLLVAISSAAIALRRRAPYLLAGWLWYLGTLVPVIGLVQVGSQAYADRYSYFPQVGVLVAICWAAADVAPALFRAKFVLTGAAALTLVIVARANIPVWHDSRVLWENARRVSGDNALTLANIGRGLEENGKTAEAVAMYRAAIRIDPDSVFARQRLGEIFYQQRRFTEAAVELEYVSRIASTSPMVRTTLGSTYYWLGRLDDAARENEAAIASAPEYSRAYINLAVVELRRNRVEHAEELYRTAVRLEPGSADAHCGLGVALRRLRKSAEGLEQLKLAVRLDPQSAQACYNLGRALQEDGDPTGAAEYLKRARQLDPAFASAP